jgi:hypothetical protein
MDEAQLITTINTELITVEDPELLKSVASELLIPDPNEQSEFVPNNGKTQND